MDNYIKKKLFSEGLLTASEVCELFGISKQKLIHLVKEGKLQAVKSGKAGYIFRKKEVKKCALEISRNTVEMLKRVGITSYEDYVNCENEAECKDDINIGTSITFDEFETNNEQQNVIVIFGSAGTGKTYNINLIKNSKEYSPFYLVNDRIGDCNDAELFFNCLTDILNEIKSYDITEAYVAVDGLNNVMDCKNENHLNKLLEIIDNYNNYSNKCKIVITFQSFDIFNNTSFSDELRKRCFVCKFLNSY